MLKISFGQNRSIIWVFCPYESPKKLLMAKAWFVGKRHPVDRIEKRQPK